MNIRPIILAGGEGKRLAPLSTSECTKPFILLPDGQSLLEKTLRRLDDARFVPPILMGRSDDRYGLMNHARAAGVLPHAILLEDVPRNTAFAIAAAVAYAPPDTVLAFLPADQMMEDHNAWQTALFSAAQMAQQGDTICLIGMEGIDFNPEYGWMELEDTNIKQFLEKPEKLPKFGEFLVNSGQFIGTSKAFSRLLAENAPEIWQFAQNSVQNRQKKWEYECLEMPDATCPSLSFDKAVIEKASTLCAVRAKCGWRDLGTLAAWLEYTSLPLEQQLSCPRRTDRPWGYYEILATSAEKTTKRLHVFAGCRLSRQRHFHRSEHWVIESGEAFIEHGDTCLTLRPGEEITIACGVWHRLINPTDAPLMIHETQLGIADENDIERCEDDYGRV